MNLSNGATQLQRFHDFPTVSKKRALHPPLCSSGCLMTRYEPSIRAKVTCDLTVYKDVRRPPFIAQDVEEETHTRQGDQTGSCWVAALEGENTRKQTKIPLGKVRYRQKEVLLLSSFYFFSRWS